MQSMSDPLNRLHEDGGWFARAHELQVLVVRCDSSLRNTVLKLLPMFEFHADNKSPWMLLPEPHTEADDGWQVRANAVAAQWGQRVEAFAKEGVTLQPVVADRSRPGLTAFRRTVAAVLGATVPPMNGLVMVLAPPVLEALPSLESALITLLGAYELRDDRYVLVIDGEAPLPRTLLDALGERALVCDCRVDERQKQQDLAALLGGGGGAPQRFGMAWPAGVTPPPRVDDPPPLPVEQRDAALRKEGIDPALLDKAPELRDLVLGAAFAMQQGRGSEAIDKQRRARDLCGQLGLHPMQVICQISLASYLSGLGQRPQALRELQQAVKTAEAHKLHQEGSQAHLARGLLHALDGDQPQAAQAYTQAARSAEAGQASMLAIESWRMAGQIAGQLGQNSQAVAAFNEAIRVATQSPTKVVQASSASEAARQLATLCQKRGLNAQAASLYAQADAMERGEVGQAEQAEPGPERPGR